MAGTLVNFPRAAQIYVEGSSASHIYQVLDGAVRVYKLLADGRRQIGGFYLPQDLFGLEENDGRQFFAEAIKASSILVIKRSKLKVLAARQSELISGLLLHTSRELAHMRNLAIMLGCKTAQERLAGFLLEMAGRLSKDDTVDLPMSRQDIADYLGLTIETVSRTFTQLENQSSIDILSRRRVVLRNRNALVGLDA
jgi:CRP-like cAMP-binding protein